MMCSTKRVAAGALAVALSAGTVSAATFDFQAIADGAAFNTTGGPVPAGAEGCWASIVGAATTGIVSGGISVVAGGTGNNGLGGTSTLNAYFDRGSAGLGVCGTLTAGAQCNPSNDDNVGSMGGTNNSAGLSFETLILTFSTRVAISALNLAGEGHGLFGGTVSINGTNFGPGAFAGVGGDYSTLTAAALASLGQSVIWSFQYVPVSQVSSTDEFYIDSITVAAVPIPAAGLMLLGALGGLAAVRRSRRAA